MKQGSLFCFVCHAEIFQITTTALHYVVLLVSSESSQWVSRGALTWFEIAWSYGVEAIDYWIIFSIKILIQLKLKIVLEFGAFLALLESSSWVRFNKVYFTIFRAKVWKILTFEWILLLEIQTNCEKNWVLKEKSVEPSMCSHCRI
jgi:hypothetical protein